MTDNTGPAARILAYWHAIEMFDPQKIPEPMNARQVEKRRPGSECREKLTLAPGTPVPVLPWQPGHFRAGEPPAPAMYGSEWLHTVYGGIFSSGPVRKEFQRVLGYDERPDHGGRRKDVDTALFSFTVDSEGFLVTDTEAFSSCAWATGRLNSPGPGAPGWLDGFDDVMRESVGMMRELLSQPIRYIPDAPKTRTKAPAASHDSDDPTADGKERHWRDAVTEILGSSAAAAVAALISGATTALGGPIAAAAISGAATAAIGKGAKRAGQSRGAEDNPPEKSARFPWRHIDSRPLHVLDVVALAAYFVDLLGLPDGLVNPLEVRVVSKTAYRKKDGSISQDPVFLNSFIAPDIRQVRDAVANRDAGPALLGYLSPELPDGQRTDLARDRDRLLDGLSPKAFGPGRWPAPADQPLAASQQFAVNAIPDEPGGLFSVNGPPGTGKTTLLRDLIAGIIVDRARVLAALRTPADGFPRELTWTTEDGRRRSAWQPRADLTGFEILVASSNNAAVENITTELPGSKAIGGDWREEADYFGAQAEVFFGEPSWGIIAAPLGNKGKRNQFKKVFWWAGNGMKELLANRRNDPPPAEAWESAVKRFTVAMIRSDEMKARRGQADTAVRTLVSAARVAQADRAAEAAEAALAGRDKEAADAGGRADELERQTRTCLDMGEAHDRQRPRGLRALLGLARTEKRLWRERAEQYAAYLADTGRQLADARQALDAARTAAANARDTRDRTRHDAGQLATRRQEQRAELRRAREEWGDAFPQDWRERPQDEQELAAPWSDEEWTRARTEVFLAAIHLHKTFVEATAKQFLRNFEHLFGLMDRAGSVPEEPAKAAWQTLFLLVPVVSTTFASCGRMLGALGREDLGWLLVDEAGQALPQAAVGAMWRARRAVVVGDPLQLTPISQVPDEIQAKLRETYDVGPEWQPSAISAQAVADRRNRWGTRIGGTWVGAPLRVHRRCEQPMFGVSNDIAYDGLMVGGTVRKPFPGEPDPDFPGSSWTDVTDSAGADGKWVRAQGDALLHVLRRLHGAGVTLDRVYVLSPFVQVANRCRSLIDREFTTVIKSALASAGTGREDLDESLRNFLKTHVGTVHTMQGKEADVVIFVLGTDPSQGKGAVGWASGTVNLLNVAVSRAKRRFFVIGNRAEWKDAPYFSTLAARLPAHPWGSE